MRMDPLANPRLHRHILAAGAVMLFLVSTFLVVGPLLVPPATPLMDRFFWIEVPLAYQRALVVLLGAAGLVLSALLVTFRPFAWWTLMACMTVGVVQGLVAVPAFLPTMLNILCAFYLWMVRPLYGEGSSEPLKDQ